MTKKRGKNKSAQKQLDALDQQIASNMSSMGHNQLYLPVEDNVITFSANQYGEYFSATCRDIVYGDVVRAFRHFSLGLGFQPDTVNEYLGEPD